ncbi:putative membrane protein [Helicobacter pylori Hp P-2]|uniref:Putative membrane protein n=1 Tax=Helicobacter pylori Hp P-2 TaxID=992073 RepID=J0EGT7_HELPX|nr:putative membrane protein [Helicobacter pylori Hp P-2]
MFVFNISCLFVLDFLNLTSCFFHSYFYLLRFNSYVLMFGFMFLVFLLLNI